MENYVHENRFSILALWQTRNVCWHRFSNGFFYLVGPVEFPRGIREGAHADKMLPVGFYAVLWVIRSVSDNVIISMEH